MTDTKIALLIIYNHRYDNNIPRLEEIYSGKFSNIFHIIPFYDGKEENVITVFDCSYYFESFIAQSYQKIKDRGFTHFFFVADDMILNPAINENNLFQFTGISKDCCWINDLRDYVSHPHAVPLYTPITKRGVEVAKYLPSQKDVCKIFERNNLSFFPGKRYGISNFFCRIKRHQWLGVLEAANYLFNGSAIKNKHYPGCRAFSDTFIITSSSIEKFAYYCGAFGALNVFVEYAIPLALLLSSTNIMTRKDIRLKTVSQLYGLGKEGQKAFEDKYAFSLQNLLSDYPTDWFFCHPIKLSKWK